MFARDTLWFAHTKHDWDYTWIVLPKQWRNIVGKNDLQTNRPSGLLDDITEGRAIRARRIFMCIGQCDPVREKRKFIHGTAKPRLG